MKMGLIDIKLDLGVLFHPSGLRCVRSTGGEDEKCLKQIRALQHHLLVPRTRSSNNVEYYYLKLVFVPPQLEEC